MKKTCRSNDGPLDGFALVLDAATFGTTTMLLNSNHFTQDQIFIPNHSICRTLIDNAIQREWPNLHIIDAASATVISELSVPPGPLFRFVYLDYTAVWSGNRSKKPFCVPEEEVIQLFYRRRFYDRSVLAITLTRRDTFYSDSMVKTAEEALRLAAARNKYRFEKWETSKYTSETNANMVLIYGLIVNVQSSNTENTGKVEKNETDQVRMW